MVVWVLNARAQRFLPSLARLLADPVVEGGAWALLSGGRFSESRWRDVLQALRTVAGSLDAVASPSS